MVSCCVLFVCLFVLFLEYCFNHLSCAIFLSLHHLLQIKSIWYTCNFSLQFPLLPESCLPLIPEKGTVGASGDLAPLAHLALGLMGEGMMWSPKCGWTTAELVSIFILALQCVVRNKALIRIHIIRIHVNARETVIVSQLITCTTTLYRYFTASRHSIAFLVITVY